MSKLPLNRLLLGVSSFSLASIFSLVSSVTAIPVSNTYINFAGAGGDFSSRTATFRASESTTTTPVKDGLRLYNVHLAKMIEVSEHFCRDRDSDYKFYWNYEADQGKVFMGQFSWSYQFARDTLKKFGSSGEEKITIHYVDNPQSETISALNLSGKNAQEFMGLVKTLKPQCIDYTPKICPGDRLD
jgi:serine/threonine-protein kinase